MGANDAQEFSLSVWSFSLTETSGCVLNTGGVGDGEAASSLL